MKRELVELYGASACYWCGIILPENRLTIDHIKPKSRGGSNSKDNLVPACRECNHKRGNSLFPPNWKKRIF